MPVDPAQCALSSSPPIGIVDTAPAVRVAPQPPGWWLASASWLGLGYGVVLVVLVALHAGASLFSDVPAIAAPGRTFELVRGIGNPSGDAFVLARPDLGGAAILTLRTDAFSAAQYSRVEWRLAQPSASRPEIVFLWRTREQPGRTHVKPLHWVDAGLAPLELGAKDGWAGTVTGIGLAVRGAMPQPIVLDAVVLPGNSAASVARVIGDQWSRHYPFRGASITLPFDREREDYLPLPVATALAVALALAGCWLLARRRGWPHDPRVFWAVFLGGWLVLDARWQVNLWHQLGDTAREYAGKTTEQKHYAADDRELYAIMRTMAAALPAAPVRIMFLSDNPALRARGAFFLYPHNVDAFFLHDPRAPRTIGPRDGHPGDYVLLFLYRGIAYDRAARELVWPDGARRPVDEVAYRDEHVVLVRLK
jgi:hypothetical protein